MVHIPALDGLTQARRLAEADQMAREWIVLATDASIDDVTVNVTVEREALPPTAALAKALAAEDVPVRDIGVALGVRF